MHNIWSGWSPSYKDSYIDNIMKDYYIFSHPQDLGFKEMATKKQPTTTELLETLTKGVSSYYIKDATRPSIIVSYLDNKYSNWYVSVVRYDGAFANGKQVVVAHSANNLNTALTEALKKFVQHTEQVVEETAYDKLKKFAKEV